VSNQPFHLNTVLRIIPECTVLDRVNFFDFVTSSEICAVVAVGGGQLEITSTQSINRLNSITPQFVTMAH
jgi:hypothetical protein